MHAALTILRKDLRIEWRIVERTKVADWGRAIAGDEAIYDNGPLEKGRRDASDASYRLFS